MSSTAIPGMLAERERSAMRRRRGRQLAWLLLASLILAPACTNQNTWRPSVDPYDDENADRLGRDEAECRQIAQQAAGGSTTKETAKGAGAGAAIGAVGGAIIGAMAGSPGTGAAAGAAAGGAAGGTYKNVEASNKFKTVFKNCMRERGHKVLDD